jgi:hypothetical protein
MPHGPPRPTRCTAQPAGTHARARPRKHRAGPAANERDDDDLDAYIKEMIDSLPPLTSEQRDKLALIFRSNRRRKLTPP